MQPTQTQLETEQQPPLPSRHENARRFDAVLLRCLPSFQRMAFRKLRNTADAEDAVQDALLSAYTHLHQFKGGAQMSTWMTTIVINCARMQLRGRSRYLHLSLDEQFGDEQKRSLSDELADSSPSPEDESRGSELRARVCRYLNRLSPTLRRTFKLRELDGLSTHEAAAILGVPEGTVKAQLARARARMRQLMLRSVSPRLASVTARS